MFAFLKSFFAKLVLFPFAVIMFLVIYAGFMVSPNLKKFNFKVSQ